MSHGQEKVSRLSLISAKVEEWGKKSMRGTVSMTKSGRVKVSRLTPKASVALLFKPQQTKERESQ
jgi:hypothetical protein